MSEIKPKFTAKEGDAGAPCFVYEETNDICMWLKPPADIQLAEEVANYLNKNVSGLEFGLDDAPPGMMRG